MDRGCYSNALDREGEGKHDWLAMLEPEMECAAGVRDARRVSLETKVAQANAAKRLNMDVLRGELPLQLVKNRRTRPALGHRYQCQTGCLLCCEPPPKLGEKINVTW